MFKTGDGRTDSENLGYLLFKNRVKRKDRMRFGKTCLPSASDKQGAIVGG